MRAGRNGRLRFKPDRIDPDGADVSGSPAAQIVRYAKERDIDLIVMGTPVRRFDAYRGWTVSPRKWFATPPVQCYSG